MKPKTIEEAEAIDRVIALIASHAQFTYLENEKFYSLEGVNDNNLTAFLKMIEIELNGLATVNLANGEVYTNKPEAFQWVLDNGGFTKIYEADSKRNKEELRRNKLDIKQKTLSIESLEDSLRYARSARKRSLVALVASIVAGAISIGKLLYDVLK